MVNPTQTNPSSIKRPSTISKYLYLIYLTTYNVRLLYISMDTQLPTCILNEQKWRYLIKINRYNLCNYCMSTCGVEVMDECEVFEIRICTNDQFIIISEILWYWRYISCVLLYKALACCYLVSLRTLRVVLFNNSDRSIVHLYVLQACRENLQIV